MMQGFRYAVLRFMPDPEREETLNVGVVVAPANRAPLVRVLESWDNARLRALGYQGSMDFLSDVAGDVETWGPSAAQTLLEASKNWGGTLRVSEPRGALHADPQVLLEDLFARYVSDERPTPRLIVERARDRHVAKRVARDSLRRHLPATVVRSNPVVAGKVESHRFDVGVQNGHLLEAVATLSFDIRTRRLLAAEVDACAWALSDVLDTAPNVGLTVVTIGGTQRTLLRRIHGICDSLNVDVVPEAKLGKWAKGVHDRVQPALSQRMV